LGPRLSTESKFPLFFPGKLFPNESPVQLQLAALSVFSGKELCCNPFCFYTKLFINLAFYSIYRGYFVLCLSSWRKEQSHWHHYHHHHHSGGLEKHFYFIFLRAFHFPQLRRKICLHKLGQLVRFRSNADCFVLLFVWHSVLLCGVGCPQTHDPPVSVSGVLEL
jgi:hypothetical protein